MPLLKDGENGAPYALEELHVPERASYPSSSRRVTRAAWSFSARTKVQSSLPPRLGHGMTDVARLGWGAHHYLGARSQVLADLMRFPSYPNIDGLQVLRNNLGHVQMLVPL